jgi:hypothetical protein
MYTHMRRLALLSLSIVSLILLAGCTNVSGGNPNITSQQSASMRVATVSASSTASSGAHSNSSLTTGSAKAHATTTAAKASASAGTSSSSSGAYKGPLTLTLACSGPKAQDGFSVNGSHAKACVYTAPGASLTIKVSFCNGKPDPSSALQGTFVASASGFYAWDWTPQTSCLSAWSVAVTAHLNGQSAAVARASAANGSSSASSSSSSSSASSSASSSISLP